MLLSLLDLFLLLSLLPLDLIKLGFLLGVLLLPLLTLGSLSLLLLLLQSLGLLVLLPLFLLPLLLSCLVSFAAPEVFLVKTTNKENQIISTKSKNQHSQDKMSKNNVTEQGGGTA